MLFTKNVILLATLTSSLFSACKVPSTEGSVTDTTKFSNPNGRNDAWSYIGFGGGGATFYPAVSPHNPDVAFLSCDMTGSFATKNGGKNWRMFTLHGVTHAYVFDPKDASVVYALVRGNAGGLYRSTDTGNTWNLLYPSPADVSGIVARGDHAEEVLITSDSVRRNVTALAVDPDDSKKLYAVSQKDQVSAFYNSSDGGVKWNKEYDLDADAKNVFVSPQSSKESRTIYITSKSGIAVRENGKWKVNKAPAGVKELTEFGGGFDTKNQKFVIYSISGKSYFNPVGDLSGIYYTDNGGATWSNRQDGLLKFIPKDAALPEWRSVATSANHPEVIYISYAGFRTSKDTTCIGVAKSTDFGMTWTLPWRDGLTKGADKPASNLDGGWISERYDPTWGENPFSIAVSSTNPGVVYTTDFGRVIKTADGGKSWQQVYTNKGPGGGWTSRGIEVTCSYGVFFDPFNEQHVFITNTDVGLMESFDRAKSWKSATVNNGIPRQWLNSTYWMIFDPEVKDKSWAVMSGTHDLPRPKMWRRTGISKFTGGVVETVDGGKSWKPISSQIGESALTHILMDPKSPKASRTLYVCAFGKGVYKSVDGGKTWQQKNNGISGKEPFAWRIFRRESDETLFLVVSRRSDDGSIGNELDGALYRSTNGAETWEKITLPEGTNAPTSLEFDPEYPNRILLAAWGRVMPGQFTPDTGGGIFISDDNGAHWKPTLPEDQHVHDLSYDARVKTFYACGFTGSAYKSTDGIKWDRIPGYNFKWGRRVDFDPADPSKIFILTFGGGVWYGPAQGDPSAPEDVIGRLPVR